MREIEVKAKLEVVGILWLLGPLGLRAAGPKLRGPRAPGDGGSRACELVTGFDDL